MFRINQCELKRSCSGSMISVLYVQIPFCTTYRCVNKWFQIHARFDLLCLALYNFDLSKDIVKPIVVKKNNTIQLKNSESTVSINFFPVQIKMTWLLFSLLMGSNWRAGKRWFPICTPFEGETHFLTEKKLQNWSILRERGSSNFRRLDWKCFLEYPLFFNKLTMTNQFFILKSRK